MKCKHCDGVGFFENGSSQFKCVYCDGTGEVEMTGEEWLRSATFEELAGAIYEWYSQGHIEGKVGKQLSSVTRVVEWLKEKHDGSV